jgi:hypothetical protein
MDLDLRVSHTNKSSFSKQTSNADRHIRITSYLVSVDIKDFKPINLQYMAMA